MTWTTERRAKQSQAICIYKRHLILPAKSLKALSHYEKLHNVTFPTAIQLLTKSTSFLLRPNNLVAKPKNQDFGFANFYDFSILEEPVHYVGALSK